MSLFDIALSGLRASEYAKHLTASNIANANNPFYSRRGVEFLESSSALFGSGVKVGDVRRIIDDLASQQLIKTKYDFARSKSYFEKISQLEVFIDDEDTSVIKFINESKTALDSLNATPGSVQARKHYLNQLENLANRLHDVDRRLKSEFSETKSAISSSVDQVNQILENLTQINKKVASQNGQGGASNMPLFDQREKLLSDLANLIDFNYEVDDNGELEIQLNNGLSLLVDNRPSKLVMIQTDETQPPSIGVETSSGPTPINDLFKSGSINGLKDYYNSLKDWQVQLDRIALTIGKKLNDQNQLGVDINGELGGLIFDDINAADKTDKRVVANLANGGSGDFTVLIDDSDQLKDSEYELRFTSATDYNLYRKSDGQLLSSGTIGGYPHSVQADGFTINIDAGTFSADDIYTITPTKDAARDLKLAMKNGEKLALGSPIIVSESTQNKGSGEISLDSVIDTDNSSFSLPKQLNPPIRVEFINSTTYQLVNANDNSIIENNLTYDPANGVDVFPTSGGYDPGYRIHLSGQIEAGDTFSINYNADGVGDNRNGLLLGQLYLQSEDTSSFTSLYQGLVLGLSSDVNAAQIRYESDTILQEQAQTRRDDVSGVSLQEEMMNMSRYQEFYMANAQVLDTVNQTMDTIFSLLRR